MLHIVYCHSWSLSHPGLVALEISHQAFYHLSMNKPWVPILGIHTARGHTAAHMWLCAEVKLSVTDINSMKEKSWVAF